MQKTYTESSVASYCLIMALYSGINSGLVQIFWIYISLMILLSVIYTYRVYSNDEKNKTYTFFAFDNLAIGLFLISIYFDSHYKFINFKIDLLARYFLIIGLILILTHILRYKRK